MRAFAYRSGLIDIAEEIPDRSMPLAEAEYDLLVHAVQATCRMSYKNEPLVPGVPEAVDESAALDAVLAYQVTLQKTLAYLSAENAHG